MRIRMRDMAIRIFTKYDWAMPLAELLASHERFLAGGRFFHQKARNTLRIYECGGREVVVKSFDGMSALSRIIYGVSGNSKARKAHDYAERLRACGIDTPESVAYVDVRKGGRLLHSYSVTMMSAYESVGDVWEHLGESLHTEETQRFLRELGRFLFQLHETGAIHGDLNRDNIMFERQPDDTLRFQVIDINRMSFHSRLSLTRRIWDTCRMGNDAVAKDLFSHYARNISQDIAEIVEKRTRIRRLYDMKRDFKRWWRRKRKEGLF